MEKSKFLIWHYDEVTSTMDKAKELLGEVQKGQLGVVLAENQTHGRGRQGREWISAPGGLYATFILKHAGPIESLSGLSLLVGLAVVSGLSLDKSIVGLKWPNDIVMRSSRQKLGGILVESIPEENQTAVLIGIGLNLDQVQDPKTMGSLKMILSDVPEIETIVQVIGGKILSRYERFSQERFEVFMQEWNSWCVLREKRVVLQNGKEIIGTCTGITKEGSLRLQTEGTEKIVHAGHIVNWEEEL